MGVTVLVCRKCKRHDCLEEFLEEHTDASIGRVRCQKICDGPVVAVPVQGRLEWFERVGKTKPMSALAALVRKLEKGKNPDIASVAAPLRKRRVKKYSGRPPR